jgi:hypothetical protein
MWQGKLRALYTDKTPGIRVELKIIIRSIIMPFPMYSLHPTMSIHFDFFR